MSLARLKRLRRLEARQPRGTSYFDVAPLALPIFEAMFEGRPFSWLPPDRELSPEQEQGIERIVLDLDGVAKRLETQDPSCTAAFQADVERKRRAVLAAIEREAKAREAP